MEKFSQVDRDGAGVNFLWSPFQRDEDWRPGYSGSLQVRGGRESDEDFKIPSRPCPLL